MVYPGALRLAIRSCSIRTSNNQSDGSPGTGGDAIEGAASHSRHAFHRFHVSAHAFEFRVDLLCQGRGIERPERVSDVELADGQLHIGQLSLTPLAVHAVQGENRLPSLT